MAIKRGSRSRASITKFGAGNFKGRAVVATPRTRLGNAATPGASNARARGQIARGNYAGRRLSRREAASAGMSSGAGGTQ